MENLANKNVEPQFTCIRVGKNITSQNKIERGMIHGNMTETLSSIFLIGLFAL